MLLEEGRNIDGTSNPRHDRGNSLEKDPIPSCHRNGDPLKPDTGFKNSVEHGPTVRAPVPSKFQRWNAKIESPAGLEARGIRWVEPNQRDAPSLSNYIQMSLIWLSANVTANNLALGLPRPLVYNLGFTDAALCAALLR